ncbi:MAG TPA: serine protease [Stellaceae bacterium]|nr:serine protease [Stellaceae bacterium]
MTGATVDPRTSSSERSPKRLVELFAHPGGAADKGNIGSGYLLGSGLVLTARHVLVLDSLREQPSPSLVIEVRALAEGVDAPLRQADLVWPKDCKALLEKSSPDVALIRLRHVPAEYSGPVRVGVGDQIGRPFVEVYAGGFPAQRYDEAGPGRRETQQIFGRVPPLAGARSSMFEIVAIKMTGERELDPSLNWLGMSGAALFNDQEIIGVVITRAEGKTYDFRAVRLADVWEEDTEFYRLLDESAILPLNTLIRTMSNGLEKLASIAITPQFQKMAGAFQADFATTRDQISILTKCKALHELLHHLQLQFWSIDSALARRSDPPAARALRQIARGLKHQATAALEQINGLPNYTIEEAWINKFQISISEIDDASKVAAPSGNFDVRNNISEDLRRTLQEAPRVNGQLAQAASNLKLARFGVIIENIVGGLDSTTNEQTVDSLNRASRAVTTLSRRLSSLVAEHIEWQWLDKELGAAENSSAIEPVSKIPLWVQFKEKLTAVGDLALQDNPSIDLKGMMFRWEEACATELRGIQCANERENAFVEFRNECMLRFYDVDGRLRELCRELMEVVTPLNAILDLL